MNKSELLRQSVLAFVILILLQSLFESLYISLPMINLIVGAVMVSLAFFMLHRGVGLGVAIFGTGYICRFLEKVVYPPLRLTSYIDMNLLVLIWVGIIGYLFYRQHRQCCMNLKPEESKVGSDNTMHNKVLTAMIVVLGAIGIYFNPFVIEYGYSDIKLDMEEKQKEFFKGHKSFEELFSKKEDTAESSEEQEAYLQRMQEWNKSQSLKESVDKVHKRLVISFICLNIVALLSLYLGMTFINPLIGAGYLVMSVVGQLYVDNLSSPFVPVVLNVKDFIGFLSSMQIIFVLLSLGIIVWLSLCRNKK